MIKVIPTIGPASEELKDIKFLQNYTNIFRLNSSHNTIKWHKSISDKIKLSSQKNKILIDIPGIKPRTSNTADIKIKKNERILFYYKIKPNIKNNISKFIPLSNPIPQIKKKVTFFSISDGSFEFKATGKSKNYIIGTSKQSFVLKKNKGLNIPLSVYSDNLQKKKYLFFLKAINRLNYDAVGLSFVQNHNIINFIKNKYPKKIIVSKIENYEGLRNAKEICKASDVIMIDRGDLSAEIGNDNLFDAIIEISKLCENLHKPLIMATENLDSWSYASHYSNVSPLIVYNMHIHVKLSASVRFPKDCSKLTERLFITWTLIATLSYNYRIVHVYEYPFFCCLKIDLMGI